MRWMWIDKFVEFESGRRACAIKNVTRAEDHVHDMIGGYAVLPPSLMVEGMAQTAGVLVGEARQFRENVVLAKIRLAEFEDYAYPGDQLRYEATIETLDDQAAVTLGVVLKNGLPIGRVDLIFAHVNQSARAAGLPEHNFVFNESFKQMILTARQAAAATKGSGS
jgi:3-hydroxyacyl-[acyl-carrier-protein] dehydratase